MSTNTTQSTIPQIIPTEYGGGLSSIKSYSEFMLNKMMFDKLLNSKTTMEFTPANIAKLMLIMCAPDIKTLVVEAGKYLAGIVKDCPQYLFTVLKYIYSVIQSIKRVVSHGLSGRWMARHPKPTDFHSENDEYSLANREMWNSVETYSLSVDSIFTAELIKFIETNKHKHTKSCVDIKVDGVNITRQYMLSGTVINWTDDTDQQVEIEINNNIAFSTTAKLANSANETLVKLYGTPFATGYNPDEYVFPPELGITEYWDLLSNPIFKETYPFMDDRGCYSCLKNNKLLNTSLTCFKSKKFCIAEVYRVIRDFIANQNFKVYGIPNANPDITNHCLTLIMIYLHIGRLIVNLEFTSDFYDINPLLINIKMITFMKDIQLLLEVKNFHDLLNYKFNDMSQLNKDLDVYWICYFTKANNTSTYAYNCKINNNIAFTKSEYALCIPKILTEKLNRNHVTQERFDKFMADNSPINQIKSANETKVVSLDILLRTKTPSVNSAAILAKFLETIRANSVSLNTKCMNSVPVKYIKLKQTETTTETDNPAYKEWVKKKDLILSNIAPVSANSAPIISNPVDGSKSVELPNSNGVIQLAAINSYLPSLVESMPPEKLVSTTIKLSIDEQTINQTCRQMQSLSLKTRDKKKLMCALDDYLEDGPTLKAWGIKNKLNILLYGEPGTGKSSTIEAIATYLNKPIYYVDMKEARTNNDLKLIFDHVNSVAVGGGIIVMEDIDAMTECVHKRISANQEELSVDNTTVSAIMSEKDTNTLTLEFFLNILDGVLTADKSIFITTTNHIEKLDPAFYRAGRFNLKIELGPCNHDQMNYIYKNMRGTEIPTKILLQIPEHKFKPAEFIFHIKDYVRDFTLSDTEILEPFMQNM